MDVVPRLIIRIEKMETENIRFLKMEVLIKGYFDLFSILQKTRVPNNPASNKYFPLSLLRLENPSIKVMIIKKKIKDPLKSNLSPFDPAQSDLISLKTIKINNIPKGMLNKKMLLQPNCWIKNPPNINPIKIPAYTDAVYIP